MKRFHPASLALALALTPAARAQNAALPGDVQFDGAHPHPAAAAAAAGAPGGAAPDQDADLLNRLFENVTVRPDADPRAAPALREAFATLLKSRTGRELVKDFVAEGAAASVGFETMDGAGVVEENGVLVTRGSGGYTQPDVDPPLVTLNRAFLDADAGFRRVELARVLAHEMLGHALEAQRVQSAGLAADALSYYRGDEGNASMIGWLVQTELGGRLINWSMWKYLEEPEHFYKGLELLEPDYALSLSPEQMSDPLPVWNGRLDRIPGERASLDDYERDLRRGQLIIRHFIADHGIAQSRFKNLSDDFSYEIGTGIPDNRKRLDKIEKVLRSTIRYSSTPEGRNLLANMRAAAGSAYVAGIEDRMDARAGRLRAEIGNRQRETAAPPDPNQITWDQLHQMWRDDDPGHRAGIP